MKTNLLFLGLIVLLSSYYPYEEEPFAYTPILMTRQSLENSVEMLSASTIEKPGKIYFKDNYIFINEKYKGVHIINNANPENPIKEGFIRIPGCIDMAMKGNILYADNAVDLVAIDLSDPSNIQVTSRVKNVFPELLPPGKDWLPWTFTKENRPENTIIVGWK